MENKEFVKLLEKMREIHSKKAEDYSSVGFFENFDRQATLIGWFKNDTDKAFIGCIGIKLARLATLLDSGKQPNNESIEDSFLDLCTYCALWASYHATMKAKDVKESFESNIVDRAENKDWHILSGFDGKNHITVPKHSKICYTCRTRILGTVAVGERVAGENRYYHVDDRCINP